MEAAEAVASAYEGEGEAEAAKQAPSCEEVAARLESASDALATLAGASDAVAVEVQGDAQLGPRLERAMARVVSGRLRCP
ncbi:hypothetical protein G6O69_38690 [Pseudenhygromyxa sp. WMMC2535]|uniref:hypothetical protein n=1 Tax=Pseudenhygromyxa sp. WMMC2535 TaxID=2712867 RepID=UPI0015957AB2|nr:hypothetical protein [Pseudenhygromyxa sp. WMMC2535]NVB43789.1 hypothetical protein [Pseudenhygromyxa sp. WMMC2535]